MDPRPVGPEQWEQIQRALTFLVVFVGLAINAALAFLLGHALIPSLARTAEAPGEVQRFRRVLDPVVVVALALALYALGRGLALAVGVLPQLSLRSAA